jgi:hypothetical protein
VARDKEKWPKMKKNGWKMRMEAVEEHFLLIRLVICCEGSSFVGFASFFGFWSFYSFRFLCHDFEAFGSKFQRKNSKQTKPDAWQKFYLKVHRAFEKLLMKV